MAQQKLHGADALMTAREASEALDVDKSTITRWVQQGTLKPLRPKPLVFAASEVERVRALRAGEIGDVIDRVEIEAAAADPMEARKAYRRECYLHAIREVTKRGGTFHVGQLRSLLPEDAAGPEGGALITTLVRQGIIRHTGTYAESGDARNRHGSTPCKVYELVGDLP